MTVMAAMTVGGSAGAQSLPQAGSALLTMPTADLMLPGTFQGSAQWFDGRGSLGVAVTPSDMVELAVVSSVGHGNPLGFTGKVRLAAEGDVVPNTALGLALLREKVSVFGVISKELGTPGVRIHAAFGTEAYQRGMVGFSAVLNPVVVRRPDGFSMPVTTVVVEYDGQGVNGGLKMRLSDNVSTQLTLANLRALGFGVQYRTRF